MKKIIAMVMALVFAVSMMVYAANKAPVTAASSEKVVSTASETGKAVAPKVKKHHNKGKKAPAKPVEKPAETPVVPAK